MAPGMVQEVDFPSFSEGLSLRATGRPSHAAAVRGFPFLFGGTFIEGQCEARGAAGGRYFPSFSEGLSLRDPYG